MSCPYYHPGLYYDGAGVYEHPISVESHTSLKGVKFYCEELPNLASLGVQPRLVSEILSLGLCMG